MMVPFSSFRARVVALPVAMVAEKGMPSPALPGAGWTAVGCSISLLQAAIAKASTARLSILIDVFIFITFYLLDIGLV